MVGRQKVSARQEVGWGSRAVRAGGVLFHKFKVRREKKPSPQNVPLTLSVKNVTLLTSFANSEHIFS